jgi:hypothetical protein
VSVPPPRLFAPAAMDLESAVRRGDAQQAAEHEAFVAGPHGRPEELGWLLDLYGQLRVPHDLRAVGERDLRARSLARWPECDLAEVRVDARLYREQHVAACRWNAEHNRIRPGWIVLPGDPPPRSPWSEAA